MLLQAEAKEFVRVREIYFLQILIDDSKEKYSNYVIGDIPSNYTKGSKMRKE